MAEMLLRKAALRPWMAAPIKVTVTMPITMPSVVSPERILLARIASQEMASPSRSSVRKFIGQWIIAAAVTRRLVCWQPSPTGRARCPHRAAARRAEDSPPYLAVHHGKRVRQLPRRLLGLEILSFVGAAA